MFVYVTTKLVVYDEDNEYHNKQNTYYKIFIWEPIQWSLHRKTDCIMAANDACDIFNGSLAHAQLPRCCNLSIVVTWKCNQPSD